VLIRLDFLIGSRVVGPQLKLSFLALRRRSQAINSEAQVRRNLIIDDIVVEYGVRIEGVLRQRDAVFVRAIFAD